MQYLGKYAQYWWKKEISAHYEQVRTKSGGYWYGSSRNDRTFYYSDTVENNSGSVSMVKPSSLTIRPTKFSSTDYPQFLGHYLTTEGASVIWVPSTTSYYNTDNPDAPPAILYYINSFETITYKYVETQLVGYVQSNNRNAYPDSGQQDGYKYTYLGVPLSNAALLTISDKL